MNPGIQFARELFDDCFVHYLLTSRYTNSHFIYIICIWYIPLASRIDLNASIKDGTSFLKLIYSVVLEFFPLFIQIWCL